MKFHPDSTNNLPVILLGSASPRRKQILETAGFSLVVVPSNFDESALESRSAAPSLAQALSREKLYSLLKDSSLETLAWDWLLTADTLVYIQKHTLGKPRDRSEAREMLGRLSGNWHRVVTAYNLYQRSRARHFQGKSITQVQFRRLSPFQIEKALDWNEWVDAAGAYQIQNKGQTLIASLRGCLNNVVGLPLSPIYDIILSNSFPSGKILRP